MQDEEPLAVSTAAQISWWAGLVSLVDLESSAHLKSYNYLYIIDSRNPNLNVSKPTPDVTLLKLRHTHK